MFKPDSLQPDQVYKVYYWHVEEFDDTDFEQVWTGDATVGMTSTTVLLVGNLDDEPMVVFLTSDASPGR